MHRSLYVSMAHCPHDGSQVPGSHENPSAVVMAGTIKDQFFRKTGLLPRLSKQVIYGAEVTRRRALGGKNPAFLSLCHTVHVKARRRDDSSEQVVALSESCCPAQRSHDVSNQDCRCACGRAPVRSSSRYLASRSRCRGRVQRFASATCRP